LKLGDGEGGAETYCGIQPTYEELKLIKTTNHFVGVCCIQPTYEELKQEDIPFDREPGMEYPAYL